MFEIAGGFALLAGQAITKRLQQLGNQRLLKANQELALVAAAMQCHRHLQGAGDQQQQWIGAVVCLQR